MNRDTQMVELIREMAAEYQQKLDALISATNSMDSNSFWKTIRAHGERTLDRFREVQSRFVYLLDRMENSDSLVKAFRNLSRCFDEMQALFLVMSDRYFQDVLNKKNKRREGGQ